MSNVLVQTRGTQPNSGKQIRLPFVSSVLALSLAWSWCTLPASTEAAPKGESKPVTIKAILDQITKATYLRRHIRIHHCLFLSPIVWFWLSECPPLLLEKQKGRNQKNKKKGFFSKLRSRLSSLMFVNTWNLVDQRAGFFGTLEHQVSTPSSIVAVLILQELHTKTYQKIKTVKRIIHITDYSVIFLQPCFLFACSQPFFCPFNDILPAKSFLFGRCDLFFYLFQDWAGIHCSCNESIIWSLSQFQSYRTREYR